MVDTTERSWDAVNDGGRIAVQAISPGPAPPTTSLLKPVRIRLSSSHKLLTNKFTQSVWTTFKSNHPSSDLEMSDKFVGILGGRELKHVKLWMAVNFYSQPFLSTMNPTFFFLGGGLLGLGVTGSLGHRFWIEKFSYLMLAKSTKCSHRDCRNRTWSRCPATALEQVQKSNECKDYPKSLYYSNHPW